MTPSEYYTAKGGARQVAHDNAMKRLNLMSPKEIRAFALKYLEREEFRKLPAIRYTGTGG